MKFVNLLLPLALASPILKDQHKTQIKLVPIEGTAQEPSHFAVTVTRVDDLVNEKEEEVAVKVSAVLLKFDVDTNGQALVNDVPVPMGLSKMEVAAKTLVAKKDIEGITDQELLDSFDEGIIGVEINVKGYEMKHNDIMIRRLAITERVLEINGKQVEQEEAVQQVLELLPDGSMKKGMPCHQGQDKLQSDLVRLHHHKHHRRSFLKFLCSGLLLGSLAAGFYYLITVLVSLFTTNKYEKVESVEVFFEKEKSEKLLNESTQTSEEQLPEYVPKAPEYDPEYPEN
ncbi:hypothetical protein HK103_004135 [Boothiomyces macroporosus]|uniref:Uncharacterized protein n=1 Tax=Boothiomyces macroporosus TaxID=261099 RepID=A0AAD5UH52_9FUNG|nr:hypothetical protein HK103_004135 [Boothiomyces macroporosus]